MRIAHLNLIRYGKFTDRPLDFPRTERDFHVIVGPNEAGKSTLRTAISDLLYSIPKNTAHAFLHAAPELRLGAKIEHGGNLLEFHRVKGNRQTLRDRADAPLSDAALGPYLGTTNRDFFEQMFGLDHERLVKGADSLLSASNDLGQILFQSAAGIASLGGVRQALETEALSLWSSRRSRERLYYVASDELDQATKQLKAVTVRAKDWAKEQSKVEELQSAYDKAKQQHADVKAKLSRLERVRRIAPKLDELDEILAQLSELGQVVELPETATQTLAEAEKDMATAQLEIDHQTELITSAQATLDATHLDTHIREFASEIEALNEQRVQYRAHAGDIGRRQAEIETAWAIVREQAIGLGWDAESENRVRERIPSPPLRTSLRRLAREHPKLHGELDAATRAQTAKRAELDQAASELEKLPASDVSLSLQAALDQTQKLGDVEAILRDRKHAVEKRQSALEEARRALGTWRGEVEALRAMSVPPTDVIKGLVDKQLADDAQAQAVAQRIRSLKQQIEHGKLEVTQYQNTHQPVTRDEVLNARRVRQETWDFIRTNADELKRRVDEYERQVVTADQLADQCHDTVKEASELRAKQAQVARLEHELGAAQQEANHLENDAKVRAESWAALAEQSGLPELPFQSAGSWLENRRATLDAWDSLSEAKGALQQLEEAHENARSRLASELAAAGELVGSEGLDVLMLRAKKRISAATDAGGQRRALQKHLDAASRDVITLDERANTAQASLDGWRTKWSEALERAGVESHADVGFMQDMLEVIDKIEVSLAAMLEIKVERIDKMRADLENHANAANALAQRVAPDLADQTPTDVALALSSRLKAANEAHQEIARQHAAMRAAQNKIEEATARYNQAKLALDPLLKNAKAASNAELAEAARKSDRRRALLAHRAACEKTLRDDGDGLSLDQLRAEVGTVDRALMVRELDQLKEQDGVLVNHLNELSAQKRAASDRLHAIEGSADAAKAEAQRQEALAKMTDAVERYVKVHTAARLLKWSIERYREAKQGPLLSSASRSFSLLTLGSFDRLTVDFDSEPPKLMGRRPNGTVVDIKGMSDGTRDQLYLALRLAALEMHLGQAHVLPFIADDLFINYDSQRAMAGLKALGELSRATQVLFLTHHDHLLPAVREVFGGDVNVVELY